MTNLDQARETFENSVDGTVGIEEEYAILDPATLQLVPEYDRLNTAGQQDPVLADSLVRGADLLGDRDPLRPRRGPRRRAGPPGRGTPPPAGAGRRPRVQARLHGHSSAVGLPQAVADRHRALPPRGRGPASTSPGATTPSPSTSTSACAAAIARSPSATGCGPCCRRCWRSAPIPPTSTRSTPACTPRAPRPSPSPSPAAGSRTPSAAGRRGRTTSTLLYRTGSIVEFTQLWWSVRPHHSFGTVEVRICDAQSSPRESEALATLIHGCVPGRDARDRRGPGGRRGAAAA